MMQFTDKVRSDCPPHRAVSARDTIAIFCMHVRKWLAFEEIDVIITSRHKRKQSFRCLNQH